MLDPLQSNRTILVLQLMKGRQDGVTWDTFNLNPKLLKKKKKRYLNTIFNNKNISCIVLNMD